MFKRIASKFLFMKIILAFSVCLLLNSCCTQKLCVNAFDQKTIELKGFTLEETKNILMESYKKNGQFNEFVDSSWTSAELFSANTNTLVIYVSISFQPAYDYKLVFEDLDRIYEITDIQMDNEKCNTCFLAQDNYDVLSSYKINGETMNNDYFEIVK